MASLLKLASPLKLRLRYNPICNPTRTRYPAPPSPTPSVAAYEQHAIQAHNDQAEGTEQARPATAGYGRQISDIAKIIRAVELPIDGQVKAFPTMLRGLASRYDTLFVQLRYTSNHAIHWSPYPNNSTVWTHKHQDGHCSALPLAIDLPIRDVMGDDLRSMPLHSFSAPPS